MDPQSYLILETQRTLDAAWIQRADTRHTSLDETLPVSISESQGSIPLHRLPHRGHAVRQPV